jgi:hypothetical protein
MHLLVIAGADPERVRHTFARALAAFETLHGIAPAARQEADGLALAAFPLASGGAALTGPTAEGLLGAEVGLWFRDELPGRPELAPLLPALLGPDAALPDALRGLDGYFALAAADPAKGELAVLTDRGGALHLYEAGVGGVRAIATSALVLAALFGAGFDRTGVRDFLATGTVYGNNSLFAGVTKLEAATLYRFRDGAPAGETRWFAIETLYHGGPTPPGHSAQLAEGMQETVRRLLAICERPVLDLTGGYDTRNVLATTLSLGAKPVAITVGAPDSRDVVAAKRIAATLGLTHRHYIPGRDLPELSFADLEAAVQLSDGEISALEYGSVAAFQKRLAPEFDLNINGTWGELCRGYWWDALFPWVGRRGAFDARDFAAKRFAVDGWADRMMQGLHRDTLLDRFTAEVERVTSRLGGYPNTAGADACYYSMRMQRWGGRIASSTLRIRAFGSPFFFLRTMTPALSAPLATRFGGRMAAQLVERLHPQLASLPMADGYPALPVRLDTAHKFAPLAVDLAQRASRKIVNKLRGHAPVHVPGAVAQGWDMRDLPEIAAMLDPASLRTRDLYEQAALSGFLEAARARQPIEKAQLGRIVTLELAARALARVPAAA